MAMQKKIGDADVKARFAFIAVDPKKFTEKNLYTILRDVIAWEEERIREGDLKDFVAFVEDSSLPGSPRARSVTNTFAIDGSIALTTNAIIQDRIKEKLFHQSAAFRQSGQKSTHPPRWLTTQTLILMIGGTRFLMNTVDLYLEREGLLRDHTFDLMKEVATLEVGKYPHAGDYYSVDVADKAFYRGYVEELGRVSGIRAAEDEYGVLSTTELMTKLTQGK